MRFGDTIYYCKKKDGVEEYEKPIAIKLRPNYFSLMPASAYLDVLTYGEDISKRYRAFAPYKIWRQKFKEGDKLYIDYVEPDLSKENGEDANAEITAVLYNNLFIKIEIRKLI